MGAFEFVVLATLRASQLIRGCLPKVDGAHTVAVTAQLEVSRGMVAPLLTTPVVMGTPADELSPAISAL